MLSCEKEISGEAVRADLLPKGLSDKMIKGEGVYER